MKKLIIKYSVASLIALSVVCGLIWRIEIEYHGWTGLIWLSYFHFALPIGFGLFMLWANQFIDIKLKKRMLINFTTCLFGVLLYIGLGTSLTYTFARGPSSFLQVIQTPEWKLNLIRYSIFIIVPLMPIGTYLIMRTYKIYVTLKYLVIAIIGVIISIPLSPLILEIINHKGSHNDIHSIKSGVLIPLWVFSMGLIIIGHKNERTTTPINNTDFDV